MELAHDLRAVDITMALEDGGKVFVATAIGTRLDWTWRRWPILRLQTTPGYQSATEWLRRMGGDVREFGLCEGRVNGLVIAETSDFLGGENFARSIRRSDAMRLWHPRFGMVQVTAADLPQHRLMDGGRVEVPRRGILAALAEAIETGRLKVDRGEKELQEQLSRQRPKIEDERDWSLVKTLALCAWAAGLRLRAKPLPRLAV